MYEIFETLVRSYRNSPTKLDNFWTNYGNRYAEYEGERFLCKPADEDFGVIGDYIEEGETVELVESLGFEDEITGRVEIFELYKIV